MLGVTQASGDFDTIKSTSNITIGAGSNWENIPESVAGVLETQACGDYMVQQYTTLNSGNRYWRFSVDKGNTWRSWFSSVVKNSDFGLTVTSIEDFTRTSVSVNTVPIEINSKVTIPRYSRILFMNYGSSSDGALLAIQPNGQTITAFRNGNIWDTGVSDYLIRNSDLGIVITKSATVAAISGQTVKIATITLLAGHTYLILGGTNASIGDSESQTSCMLQRDSGDVTSSFGLAFSRAPMGAGGGSTSWVVVKTTSQCVYSVNGYGYSSKEYNYTGLICAIQLA